MKMNKKIGAVTGLAALAVVGGTWAYYNQSLSLENPLATGKYQTELVEEFTPPTDKLQPGAEISKVVTARNTGDYPVMVRVRMDEKWTRYNATTQTTTDIITQSSNDEDKFMITDVKTINGKRFYTATQQDGEDADQDGVVAEDCTVVGKKLADNLNWTYNPNDGYWYYNEVLPAKTADSTPETSALLEAIHIASNIDLGLYTHKDEYAVYTPNTDISDIPADKWKTYTVNRTVNKDVDSDGKLNVTWTIGGIEIDGTEITDGMGDNTKKDGKVDVMDMALYLQSLPDSAENKLKPGMQLYRRNESVLNDQKQGYADANYTLLVTSEVVQATPDAVTEVFGKDGAITNLPSNIQTVVNGLTN